MQTKEIEAYSVWARTELMRGVDQRAYDLALNPEAGNFQPADAATVNGKVLPNEVHAKRAELAHRIEREGYERFVERMAYTWFNRLSAIRYMELHDFLPSHVRMLSAAGDAAAFEPQALREALTVEIAGLDRARVLERMDAADDEGTFRELLLAQCNELAGLMPQVFGEVDGADALMLPTGLLRPDGVAGRLVSDIPLEVWESVEVLGWMYQFYVSEKKDEVFAGFKKKQKVTAETLGPATQLFTPEWIVRYMVENSLGRLWMLNHPESHLRERMEYYIEPDAEHEEFTRISSPEEITLCDPACGSGHILVYAFDLLHAMYEEAGYREREIPELILSKNLFGFEIDERAAMIAAFALYMKAREHDRRIFSRDVMPDIQVLESVELSEPELGQAPHVAARDGLADVLAHLSEVGSLFQPEPEEVEAIEADLADLPEGDLFSSTLHEKLERAHEQCRVLSRTCSCVVANPPYMGSSNLNTWLGKWVGKHYPDVKRDLCTCYLDRAFSLVHTGGYCSLITSDTCMYLSSFEQVREKLINKATIISLIDTRGSNAHPDVFDANAGWVFQPNITCNLPGSYFKLSQGVGEPKRKAYLEAIHNPECGWFYRVDPDRFHDIPGSPIAYWVKEACFDAFAECKPLRKYADVRIGIASGDNNKFYRRWWEVAQSNSNRTCKTRTDSVQSSAQWYPCCRGGIFRKWYGNLLDVCNWYHDGEAICAYPTSTPRNLGFNFREAITWNLITSGSFSARLAPAGLIFDQAGPIAVALQDEMLLLVANLNSSVVQVFLDLLNPSLNLPPGVLGIVPIAISRLSAAQEDSVRQLALGNRECSSSDWDSQETSWDFKRNPLV